MARLAAGRGLAPGPDWGAALAHAAACPACGERLVRLAGAIRAPATDEKPCAEWQARLPAFLTVLAEGEAADLAFPGLGRHLATCPRCAAVADLLAAAATPESWAGQPEPPRYPRFDTSFLLADAPARFGPLGAWLAGLWQRAIEPPAAGRRESPLSAGVLGLALAALALLVIAAGTWRLFRPRELPLPVAPIAGSPTAPAAGSPTATPTWTPSATPGAGRAGELGGDMGWTPTAAPTGPTPAPIEEPTERPDRPRPTALAPAGTPPPTEAPYPPPWPTQGPTQDPYPPPGTAGPTGEPYPGP
jgi:hypothetical protein